jgi:hypothetical protein
VRHGHLARSVDEQGLVRDESESGAAFKAKSESDLYGGYRIRFFEIATTEYLDPSGKMKTAHLLGNPELYLEHN